MIYKTLWKVTPKECALCPLEGHGLVEEIAMFTKTIWEGVLWKHWNYQQNEIGECKVDLSRRDRRTKKMDRKDLTLVGFSLHSLMHSIKIYWAPAVLKAPCWTLDMLVRKHSLHQRKWKLTSTESKWVACDPMCLDMRMEGAGGR